MNIHLSYSDILKKYHSGDVLLQDEIKSILKSKNIKIVVLDDDPTGIQTVHGCLLLTEWDKDNLEKAFDHESPVFYILTNTRSMTGDDASTITRQVMKAVIETNQNIGKYKLLFISRSDSTLRGHFPLEPEIMLNELELSGYKVKMPVFFIPSFFEAGRMTIQGIHYMKLGDELIPVSETEFANDNVFGYKNADLTAYIIEKSKGSISKEDIGRISLEDLRADDFNNSPDSLFQKSQSGSLQLCDKILNYKYIIVDAIDYNYLNIFSKSFLEWFSGMDSYAVFRTSSSLPKAISGIEDKALLNSRSLGTSGETGLIVVGSHVGKSSSQLAELLDENDIKGIELDIQKAISGDRQYLDNIIEKIAEIKAGGKTPVIYTSRKELRMDDEKERLLAGKKISEYLVSLVKKMPYKPAYILAKGGITSFDIMKKSLEIEMAEVLGQIIPGVPVIKTDSANRFPDTPYIIFPGNVGDNDSLKKGYNLLK
jgi:uncharacterized protein YgbK (DUF1537 family)